MHIVARQIVSENCLEIWPDEAVALGNDNLRSEIRGLCELHGNQISA